MRHVRLEQAYKPALPLAYVQLILDYAAGRGAQRELLTQGLGLSRSLQNAADVRVSRHDAATILLRAIRLTGNPGMGFEMGLLSNITTHGLVGYGLMASATLREGIQFGLRYLPTRLPYLQLQLFEEGQNAVISVRHTVELGLVRNSSYEFFLAGVSRLLCQASAGVLQEVDTVLSCDFLQPSYYDSYRERLPPVRFGATANQLCFPAALLDHPLPMANVHTLAQVRALLERELALLGKTEDLLARIRSALLSPDGRYLGLEEVAAKLNMSPRTVRRKLASHGVSYRKILDDVLRRQAMGLLSHSSLSIEQIADQLGYSDPANFSRAFQRWTLSTPSAFRNASQHILGD